MKNIFIAVALSLAMFGCAGKAPILAAHPGTADTLANAGYNLVVAAKGFTDNVRAKHPECLGAVNTAPSVVCADLRKAIGAKDLLIDAMEIYCAGPVFNAGGSCSPPAPGTDSYTQASAKLNAAMAGYSQIDSDLKGVL